MSNLSHELNHNGTSLLHSFPFTGQSLQNTDGSSLGCMESPKLLSEFADSSKNIVSSFSICDPYSVNSAHFMIDAMNWSTINLDPDFSQCFYSNDGHRLNQEDYLEYLTFDEVHDPVVRAARSGASNSRPVVELCCMEATSSCYSSVGSELEADSSRAVDQFQLLSEVDDGEYCFERFGVQESQTNCSKRPYVGGEVVESPTAKRHCTDIASPRKPKTNPSPSKDPQSIAAKHRRERISERLKILQDLVPNGTKVDLVTMLEKAVNYVKFLQLQVKVLSTDEFWPSSGGKALEIAQVREAIDSVLSSHRTGTITKQGDD